MSQHRLFMAKASGKGYSMFVIRARILFILISLGTGFSVPAQEAEHFVYHEIRVDERGRILPWYGNGPSEAYDHNIRLLWNFWRDMRNCSNGVPYYLQHQVWTQNIDDPRGLGGDQIDMALSSWNLLYGYLGDPDLHKNMILMADYWLDHGISSPDLLWGNLPYPYNIDIHSGIYDGDMRGGRGALQPDKAASFGAELIVLYKIIKNPRYLEAATKIANTLAARIQTGDAEHSPWPFRVNAKTGVVHTDVRNGRTFEAAYTSNWTPTLRLFRALIDLKQGQITQYQRAVHITTDWLKAYPLKNNKWGPFFEDIPTADYSDTEINADTMAFYILEHPEWDDDWKRDSRSVLDWTYNTLANHDFGKWQVTPINEQTVFKMPGNSHTSRHESVELIYCDKTGDCSRKADAILGLNWATYTVNAQGQNRYPHDDVWLTDGYGDYVRHYLRSMGAAPELAPTDQNHLLRTSSVIQLIKYEADKITYTKFDSNSAELFKLGASVPKSVDGGTMSWDETERVLKIASTQNSVLIRLATK
jgi:hypothetical protein